MNPPPKCNNYLKTGAIYFLPIRQTVSLQYCRLPIGAKTARIARPFQDSQAFAVAKLNFGPKVASALNTNHMKKIISGLLGLMAALILSSICANGAEKWKDLLPG